MITKQALTPDQIERHLEIKIMNSKDFYRQNYTPVPPPSRVSQWLQVVLGVLAFAAIGVLLAWRG